MTTQEMLPRSIRFGAFEVDLSTGELCRDGRKIKLQDQPFRVLQILLEHSGQAVAREELEQLTVSPAVGIDVTPDGVSFLGVEVKRGSGGPNVPDLKLFENDVLTEFDLKLMQKVAVDWITDEVPCLEGGPGIGGIEQGHGDVKQHGPGTSEQSLLSQDLRSVIAPNARRTS